MDEAKAPRNWSTAQHFAFWIGVFMIAVGTIGLAVNPDFSVGDQATAESALGMDWNGWHGVTSVLSGIPALAVPWIRQFALPYVVFSAAGNLGIAAWTMVDDRPLGLYYLPNTSDTVLHIILTAVCLLGIAMAWRQRQPASS